MTSFSHSNEREKTPKPSQSHTSRYNSNYDDLEENLSPELLQQLQQENDMMYNEFQSMHEEVKNISKQVICC